MPRSFVSSLLALSLLALSALASGCAEENSLYTAAQRILSEFSSFAVKRRGNVVVMYAAFSPSDPRIRQPGMGIDPSLYDGSFERRVAAALDRLRLRH